MLSSRSLSSPPLPDSPTLDGMPSYAGGIDYGNLAQAWILDSGSSPPQHTPIGHSRMGSVDYGGGPHASARPSTPRSPPFLARSPSRSGYGHRNMTPEPEYGAQSVAAATNIRHLSSSTPPPAPAPGIGRARSNSRSRYHSPTSSASSSFNINSSAGNPLVLAPFNASAASVASAGSSYHSDCGAGEDDLALRALLAPDPTGRKRKWNDFTGDPAIAPRMVVVDREDGDGLEQREPMDVLQNILGMGKGDVLSLQDSLLHAMLRVKDTVDPPPKRAPSLRRRRGSIGESISSRTTSPAPGVQHVSPKNSISPFNAATHQLPAGIVSHVLGTSSPRLFSPGPPSAPMSPAPEPPSSPGPLTGSDTERERTPAPRNQFGNKSHDPRRALLTSMMESIESRTPLHQNGQVVGIPGFPIQESAHGQPVPPAFAPVPPAPAPAPSTSDQPSLHLPLTLADLEPRLISAQFTEQQVPASPMVRAHAESKRTAQPAATPSTHTQLNFARPLSPQLQSPSRAMSPIEIASGMVSPDRSRSPVLLAARSPSPQEPPPPARSPLGTKPHHAPSASQSSDLSLLIRNQALADAIFGPSEDDALLTVAQAHSARSTPSLTPEEEQDQMWHTPPLAEPSLLAFSPPPQISSSPVPPPRFSTPSPTPYEQYMSDPYDSHGYDHSPNKGSYNSSSSPVPPSDDAQLEQDVRRKVEQATAALKQSTSQVSLRERSNSIRRKRIDPSKISGPHLMSASTSVEAMPSLSPSLSMSVLASPVEPPKSAGSKFSQRFKKFGTWRNSSKPSTPIHDEPQHPNHNLSPYTASSATPTGPYHPQSMRIDSHISQMNGPASASLADVSHFRFPANSPGHSPPASAGPVFKSLVSRLGKPFGASSTDLTSSQQRPDKERGTSGQYMSTSPKSPTPSGMLGYSTPTRAPSELRRADSAQSGRYAGGGRMSSPLGSELPARGRPSIDEVAPRSPEYALQSIYDAASQAGLNSDAMEELSALLSRSMSTTSASSRTPIPDPRLSPTLTRDTSIHRPVSPPVAVERKSMIRASVPRPQTAPRSAGRDEDTRSVVIRRTIYMPSDANKGGGLSRRPSHVSHKRQSSDAAMSTHSSRYPYDRSGSPPLASRSLSRLAATEAPPPMPDFNAAYLEPGAAVGGTSSSIVDMYGDSRAATPARDRHLSISPYPNSRRSTDRGPAGEAPGQALEVLELADGRVVWQVVDGLRDEFDMDSEPDFRSRASFSSDYSMQEREDVTLHMREHRRGASKGSLTSVNAQRKATYNRPQTKVFYSDAEHIGRLIESMTHGIDSGSFTVQHNGTHNDTRPGRAERGSFDHGNQGGWSMEEHLEHVLQHVGPKSGPRAI
ncbi:hypothetical protein BKA62DRAFT_133591 [Auriculariales sp. MPI-PUGE-AT-0066]|nr:hypothetical protein BKA62DRAFT_133591 [Auriculariales sp. MPI-PUGE-AT-0066]